MASFAERQAPLVGCLAGVRRGADMWTRVCCERKHAGVADEQQVRLIGEEIGAGPLATARFLRLLLETHRHLAAGRLPPVPGTPSPAGISVFPTQSLADRLLFRGFYARVQVNGDGPLQEPPARGPGTACVCLVLGAGNVSSLPATDLLHQVFLKGRAVLLKVNPVMPALLAVFEEVFAPLIEADLLRIVAGGSSTGQYAARHDAVNAVHLTGSGRTAAALRDLGKPLTAELGNATPVLVLPGHYTERALREQAENVATMLVNNASHNCAAAQVLVTWRGWSQRLAFLDGLQEVLAELPTRPAWYPGSRERFARFCPEAAIETEGDRLPWTLVREVGEDSPFLREELFAGALGEVTLPAGDQAAFQRDATAFLNERVWGSLGATVLAPPGCDPGYAVEHLRYGTIGINHWCSLGYAWMSPPWGGYPGGDSGEGFVHNTYCLAAPRKTVLGGPFHSWPKPVWFATHRRGTEAMRALSRFYADGRWRHLPAVLWHAAAGG